MNDTPETPSAPQASATASKIKANAPKLAGFAVALAVVYYLFFHTNPMSVIVPVDWEKDQKFADKLTHLSVEDKQLLVGGLTRDGLAKAFGRPPVITSHMTVGELIQSQKSLVEQQTEQERKAAEVKKEVDAKSAAMVAEINKSIVVSFISKRNTESDYSKFIELEVAYKNNSDKEIAGIKGVMVFKDIFGDKILSINDSMDKNIKPGETRDVKGKGIDYNQFMTPHQKLYNTEFEKIKFEYIPKAVVFADGSKITVPEAEQE